MVSEARDAHVSRRDAAGPDPASLDREMMTRCIAVAVRSGEEGEYPYGVVICRAGKVVAESTNRVAHEHDVTRHAEVVAISQAQKALGTVSLDDCMIYVNAEPCVYCCYAIRESRMSRVVYALRSPHMGGVSKWNVLIDEDLSKTMPEVFDPPPEIIAGFMAREVKRALLKSNPLVWRRSTRVNRKRSRNGRSLAGCWRSCAGRYSIGSDAARDTPRKLQSDGCGWRNWRKGDDATASQGVARQRSISSKTATTSRASPGREPELAPERPATPAVPTGAARPLPDWCRCHS
jgi:tRNA(adenine34) deaminase